MTITVDVFLLEAGVSYNVGGASVRTIQMDLLGDGSDCGGDSFVSVA